MQWLTEPHHGRVWRYMDSWKFTRLLLNSGLWMCPLKNLQDEFEGFPPSQEAMFFMHQFLKVSQPNKIPNDNINSGRNLIAVNCWFIGETESPSMWNEYAKENDGVAVISTADRLIRSIRLPQKFTKIGQVKYVDFSKHEMSHYEAAQAEQRALLKRSEYSRESELRVITMNLVCPGTLNADGSPPTATQLSGPGMYDPKRSGLYLQVNLNELIESVVVTPTATTEFHNAIVKLCAAHKLNVPVQKSSLEVATK